MRTSTIAALFVIAVLTMFSTTHAQAQPVIAPGTMGITASLSMAQTDLLLPIRVSASIAIAPSVGVTTIQDAGTDLRLGITARYFLRNGKIEPYVGLRAGMLILSPSQGTGATDKLAGAMFGGEYFFDSNLSVGAEAQINATFSADNSGRFGNPGKTNFNTGTAVFATVWF